MGLIEDLEPRRLSAAARAARDEAERQLANYDALAHEYIRRGEFGTDDEIDQIRRSVAEVLDRAKEEGADVSELTQLWMEIASRVIAVKNSEIE